MELAIVAHDAPDGGLRYVISGKGQKHAMTDGLAGGFPGARNRFVSVRRPHNRAKMATSLDTLAGVKQDVSWGVFPLMNHDVLYVATNGGGGYLDPLKRDPQAVLNDVRDKVVSVEAAKSVYGIVLNRDAVDPAATADLRAAIVARRKAALS